MTMTTDGYTLAPNAIDGVGGWLAHRSDVAMASSGSDPPPPADLGPWPCAEPNKFVSATQSGEQPPRIQRQL